MDLRGASFQHFERKYFCEIIRRDFMEEVKLGRGAGEVNTKKRSLQAWD